jgi:hypothetical protein
MGKLPPIKNSHMTEKDLKKIFSQKKEKIDKKGRVTTGFRNVTFQEFLEWYNEDVFNEGCKYCQITNSRSLELFQMQRNGIRLDATRGGKRGKRLELDRVNPNLPYDNLDNLVWCCYWCNNAKSNFFTFNEFEPIARVIGNVLRNIK